MATLYKRATPSQARILRAVAGAVKNVGDAHPEYGFNEYMARSIAKRACGTLTAQWPDVLAAKSVKGFSASEKGGLLTYVRSRPASAEVCKPGRFSTHLAMSEPWGAPHRSRRSPLRLLQRDIGIMAGQARRAGNTERLAALADVLRMLSKITGQP